MATRKKPKSAPAQPAPSTEAEKPAAAPEVKKPEPKRAGSRKAKPRAKRGARRVKPKVRKVTKPRAAHPTPAARRDRKNYSHADRVRVLAAAQKDGLTAEQVQTKFGVKPVTYYSWRKKAKKGGEGAVRRGHSQEALAGMVRVNVQERLRAMLPGILKAEVAAYLEKAFGQRR